MSNGEIVRAHYGGGRAISRRTGSVTVIKGNKSRYGIRHIGTTTNGPPYTTPTNWSQINTRLTPGRVKKAVGANTWSHEWENVPFPPSPGDGGHIVDSDFTQQSLVNKALANANPNKPIVDLPLFLFELRELPGAVRDIGYTLLRASNGKSGPLSNPGNAYLAWKFGWRPLLDDLASLLNLRQSIEERVRSLNKAGSRKRMGGGLPGSSYQASRSLTRRFSYNSVTFTVHSSYKTRRWWSMRYHLDSPLPTLEDDQWGTAVRFTGLRGSPATLWNAIPWTWLIDYFITVGDFLQATQGNIAWKASDLCLMRETTCTMKSKMTGSTGSWLIEPVTKDGFGTTIRQSRSVVSLPKARVTFSPFLSSGQMGILAALGASKTSRFIRGG